MREPADVRLKPFLELLGALVRVPSVVGSEEPFFRVLQRELELHGISVRRYQGLLEAFGQKPNSLILSAHIDRNGIVATGPGEFQYAAFVAKSQGDLTGNSISEQMAEMIGGRFTGARVEAYDPWHGDEFIDQANARLVAEGMPARSLGIKELGRLISATGSMVNGATLQIPTTGYHTNNETASLNAVRGAIRLTDELIALGEDFPV